MKKFIAGLSALALAGMITMSVSADTTIAPDPDNMPAPKPGSAGLEVSYDVSPTYTVTIPAAVELSPTETQTKNITATDVKLEQGAKIVVTLDSASNTESGSTFNAKIGDSTANYTISAGSANVEVGGKVAEFDTKDGDQSAALTFSKAEGATYAGKHTEQLTFGIAVKDAAEVTPLTVTLRGEGIDPVILEYEEDDTWQDMLNRYSDILSISHWSNGVAAVDIIKCSGKELKHADSTHLFTCVIVSDKVVDYDLESYTLT